MPWGTPETIPAGTVTNVLQVPDGELWDAIVTGALYELTLAQNFQQIGALTPEEVSERFLEMWEDYLMGLANLSLADIAIYSTTTAHQTFALNAGTQMVIEKADGDDVAVFTETDKSLLIRGHIATGNQAEVDNPASYVSTTAISLLTEESITNPTQNFVFGHHSILNCDPQSDTTSHIAAGAFEVNTSISNSRNFDNISGVFGQVIHEGSGIVAGKLRGLGFYCYNFGSGTVEDMMAIEVGFGNGWAGNNAYGLRVLDEGFGFVTNGYGIYIENVSSSSNNYAIVTNAGNVVFNEGSDNSMKMRVEGATDANLLVTDGPNDAVVVGAASRSDSAKFYVNGKISTAGEIEINGDINHDGSNIGLFGTAPTTKKTVTGSRGGNAALASLLTQLAAYGLIMDSSTA